MFFEHDPPLTVDPQAALDHDPGFIFALVLRELCVFDRLDQLLPANACVWKDAPTGNRLAERTELHEPTHFGAPCLVY